MLLKIRDAVQGWIAGVIVAIIALAFSFFGLESYLQRSSGSAAPVVTINGTKVSQKEFSSVLSNIKSNYQAQSGGEVTDQMLSGMKQYALQQVIMNELLSEASSNYGLNMALSSVKQYIVDNYPVFSVNGRFSQEKFNRFLYASGMTAMQFFSRVKQDIIKNQLPLSINQSAFVTEKELAQSYQVQYQSRDFGYFLLPVKSFDAKATVTDKAVKAYYDSNKNSFKTPEQASFSYLLVSPDEIAKQVQVSESEAQDYYRQHISNFTQPKQWRVSVLSIPQAASDKDSTLIGKIYRQVKSAPDSIKSIASQYSQSQLSQQVLSSMSASDLYNAVKDLNVGEVSSPVMTAAGVSLIKVDTITPQKVESFEAVKTKVMASLKGQKVEELFAQDSHVLSDAIFTSSSSLEEAAKQLKLPIKTSVMIARSGEKNGIFSEPKVLDAAFSDDVYVNGYNSSIISLKDGSALALHVLKKEKSQVIPFDKLRDQIKSRLQEDKAQQLAGVAAYQIQSGLLKGSSSQELSKKYAIHWVEKKGVQRTDKNLPSKIVDLVFKTKLTAGKPAVNNQLQSDGNYLIIKVDGWVPGDAANMTISQRDDIKKQALDGQSQLYYLGYVDAIRDKAKIKVNESVLAAIK